MYKKIILAGGSGFLGSVIARHFRYRCREIVILSRQDRAADDNVRYVRWDGVRTGSWTGELEGADLLVNLSGRSVDCRYTPDNRAEIFRSRLEPTRALQAAVMQATVPPRLWINLASATIYRHAEDRPQTEPDGETGSGFSVDVCTAWEKTFFECQTPGTRKVALRTGFVLGRSEGAFPRLRGLVLAGLGGRQGNGRQMVSWIHEQDFGRVVEWLLEHPGAEGVFNVTAPEPLTNQAFMRLLRQACGIPFGIPAPAWLLGIAARLLGTEPELVLKSRWVLPGRLLEGGFRFYFERPESAVHDLTANRH